MFKVGFRLETLIETDLEHSADKKPSRWQTLVKALP